MATFIALLDFTDQGVRNLKETASRADEFVAAAKGAGVTVKEMYWTVGAHDGVLVLEAPDDETAALVLLSLGKLGNVRTQTLLAFGRDEIQSILSRVP
jgi:uncharacterized protein with GYD domain